MAPRPLSTGAAALLCLVATAATAACGSSTGDGSGGKAGPDAVTLGIIPIVDTAPVYLGKEKGFFSKRGIDLKLQEAQGGAVIVPGVVSGQMQFGFSNVTSLLIGSTKKLPVKVVAAGNYSTGERGADFGAILVPKDSPLKTAAELAGRTVGVNNLNNIGDTTVRASVRAAGGDPTKVKFAEISFPDAAGALATHRVDAAWVVEPFLSAARAQGARPLAWNLVDAAPDLMVAAFFTTTKLAGERAELVSRFRDAVNESLTYAQENPAEARRILGTYTKITPEVAAKLTLPRWSPEINRASVQRLADLAQSDGLVSQPPDVGALLP